MGVQKRKVNLKITYNSQTLLNSVMLQTVLEGPIKCINS